MIRIINIVFIFIFIYSNANAKIIKPKDNIKPFEVVQIQLNGLKKNNNPSKDNGIIQTWEFAHPNNKKYTGPLDKFKEMLKGKSYSMLLNHIDHKITEKFISKDVATYEVVVLDYEKKYFKFKWQVEKYNKEGPLKDCWLTTAVSQPVPYGSAI